MSSSKHRSKCFTVRAKNPIIFLLGACQITSDNNVIYFFLNTIFQKYTLMCMKMCIILQSEYIQIAKITSINNITSWIHCAWSHYLSQALAKMTLEFPHRPSRKAKGLSTLMCCVSVVYATYKCALSKVSSFFWMICTKRQMLQQVTCNIFGSTLESMSVCCWSLLWAAMLVCW